MPLRCPLLIISLVIFLTRWEGLQFAAQMTAVVLVLALLILNFFAGKSEQKSALAAAETEPDAEKTL